MRIVLFILFACVLIKTDAQIDTIQWVERSSLPDSIQRAGCGYFLIDSDFYVAGGEVGISYSTTSVVWKYHIPNDTWHQMGNLPFGGAACAASFVFNGHGYFLTARDSVSNGNCDKMLWEYDPVSDNWTRKADFPDSARQDGSYFAYDNKLYVGQTYGCTSADTHFWEYNPLSNAWSQVATLPADITAGSVTVTTLSANAYLFGGYDLGGNFLNDVWQLNITSNQWDSMGQMPGFGRCYAIAWGFDSIIIAGGGQANDSIGGLTLGSDFYSFDVSKNLWTPVVFQNSFDSTGGGATFIYNKRGYYFGGYSTLTPNYQFSNNLWSFDASKYIHDTTTGIVNINPEPSFTVYPNPSHNTAFSISTSEGGDAIFSDALGRVIDETRLKQGVNQIRLTTDDQIVFYHATLQYGATANGKVVFLR